MVYARGSFAMPERSYPRNARRKYIDDSVQKATTRNLKYGNGEEGYHYPNIELVKLRNYNEKGGLEHAAMEMRRSKAIREDWKTCPMQRWCTKCG